MSTSEDNLNKFYPLSLLAFLLLFLFFAYFLFSEISQGMYKRIISPVCDYGPFSSCVSRTDFHKQLVNDALSSGDKITGFEYISIEIKSSDYDSENELLNTKNVIKGYFND